MRKLIALLFLAFSVFFALPAQAQIKSDVLNKYTEETFGGTYDTNTDLEQSLPKAIGRIINVALSFIGVIMLVLVVYAGYLWLTAGGNEDQVAQAKNYIKNAVIGMAIALAAFVITSFVVDQLSSAIGSGSSGGGQPGGTATPPASSGSSGGGQPGGIGGIPQGANDLPGLPGNAG